VFDKGEKELQRKPQRVVKGERTEKDTKWGEPEQEGKGWGDNQRIGSPIKQGMREYSLRRTTVQHEKTTGLHKGKGKREQGRIGREPTRLLGVSGKYRRPGG